jgi:colanic acid/amylovoran biosynthesis glycosyltransferase
MIGARIAYLCSEYPAISHTFVLREVNALRRLGVEIATFSIRRTPPGKLLAQADRDACESTFAILPPHWIQLLMAHLGLAVRAPSAYFSTLGLALRLAAPGLRGGLWQCFYFVESVVLWRECRKRRIRHIHVHLANAAADIAMLASHIGSACEPTRPWSWSFTMHGPTEFADVRHFRLAEKLRDARFVVAISDYARSQLMALSDPQTWQRLQVIHVGIPIEQFTPADAAASRPHEPAILCIGRLVPEKGQAVLIEALALLAERGHRVAVKLAGEGPSRPVLEELAERLGVAAQVSFLGAVGQDQLGVLYEGASIFCLASFAEGVPVVLMEAMAMGLPVVSTAITGIPELIEDGRTGLLVAPGRPDRLADAIERLRVDPELGCELAARAREKVIEDFNAERSAEQLYALFAERLSGQPDVMNGGGAVSIATLPLEAASRSS